MTTPAQLRRSRALPAVLAIAVLTAGLTMLAGFAPAGATTVSYSGSTAGDQSTVVIHRGDEFRRELHPTGTLTAVLDDTAKRITSGSVAFAPTFTPTFTGPFGILVYAGVQFEQLSAVTGTAVPTSATSGINNVTVSSANRLRLTIFQTADGSQHPDTDATLTDPATCFADLTLSLSGTVNRRTGVLDVSQDGFTIPTFPDGSVDPAQTCGAVTPIVNQQVAGSDNSIALHLTGGPTTAHYTGVTNGRGNTIVIQKRNPLLTNDFTPSGSIVADINFTTGQITNAQTTFNPIVSRALPGVLQGLLVFAHINLAQQGAPTASLGPSGTPGVDNVKVAANVRMRVEVTLGTPNGLILTDPRTCLADLSLNLAGTVDRGTDVLTLSQDPFTIPNLRGCGLLTPALNLLIAGRANAISLRFVDGVPRTSGR